MLEKQQQLQKRRRERQKSSRGHDAMDHIDSEPIKTNFKIQTRPTRSNGSNGSNQSNQSNGFNGSNGSNSPKTADSNSDTESERTGSRTQEASSGYSSSSIESHLHRLDQISDSEMSSPDREQPISSNKSDVDPDLSLEDELLEASSSLGPSSGLYTSGEGQITKAEADKVEVEERLEEMEKVVVSLQAENRRLQTMFASGAAASRSIQCSQAGASAAEAGTCSSSSSSLMQDSFKSVDDEVQDVLDVRRGKLCRKCLNVVDATPANLIGTAFQMMGETANQEMSDFAYEFEYGIDAQQPLSLQDEINMSEHVETCLEPSLPAPPGVEAPQPETSNFRQLFSRIFTLLRSTHTNENVT